MGARSWNRRVVVPILLSVLPAVLLASQDEQVAEQRVMALARERFEAARVEFDKRVDTCIRLQRRVVDPSLFEGMALSREQQESAVFVLSERAVAACEEDAKGRLLLALGVYRNAAAHYDKPLDPQVPYYEGLLFDQQWKVLEKEAIDYASVSEEHRKRLEGLPELMAPFDFVGTLEKLRAGR